MRAALASLIVAATSVAALILTGSAAAAEGTGTTVTPYDECVDLDTGGHSCSAGRTVVRLTVTPSGAVTGTQMTNGRYEILDTATGCTTTGSYQDSSHVAAGPEQSGHVVQRTSNRVMGKTRCGDRTLDTRCLTRTSVFIQVTRDEARVRVEARVDCDPPA